MQGEKNRVGGSSRAREARLLPPTIKGALTEERFPSPATLSPVQISTSATCPPPERYFLLLHPPCSTNRTPSSHIKRKATIPHNTLLLFIPYDLSRQSGLPAAISVYPAIVTPTRSLLLPTSHPLRFISPPCHHHHPRNSL